MGNSGQDLSLVLDDVRDSEVFFEVLEFEVCLAGEAPGGSEAEWR